MGNTCCSHKDANVISEGTHPVGEGACRKYYFFLKYANNLYFYRILPQLYTYPECHSGIAAMPPRPLRAFLFRPLKLDYIRYFSKKNSHLFAYIKNFL